MTPRPRKTRYSRPKKASSIPGARSLPETVLQSNVTSYAKRKHLLHYHTHRSDRSEGGFPDSVIVGNWVMYRELKSDKDGAKVSEAQQEWIEGLEAAGVDADVWWPIDWESGKIQDEMNACAKSRKADGKLVLPDLAKTLFLYSDDRPAAGILWDSGHTGIDRVTWENNARSLTRLIAHALPTGDAEILAWLGRHNFGPNDGAAAIIEALRDDLMSAKGEQFLG